MNGQSQILVTGGAGFIGSHLVERLLRESYRVVVVDDFSTGDAANLASVEGDPNLLVLQSRVSECKGLETLVESSEAVFHLAAAVGVELVVRSPVHTVRTNLEETEVVLEAARRRRTPIVLASTSEVYGRAPKECFDERDDLIIGAPYVGRWGYACSKLMDEFLAMAFFREAAVPVTICRLFNTVGPRQTGRYGMVLPRFIQAAKEGRPLRVFGDGSQTRCFCYVQDTVEALVRLQRNPETAGEIFNIGSTEEVSIRALAERVIQLLGSTSSIELVPYNEAYEPGFEDMPRRKPITEKLYRATGFRPATTLDEIIELTARSPRGG